MKKGGLLKTNWVYLLWVIVYITLSWLILGASKESFIITIIAYTISISIALSPMGEYLLRFLEGLRKVSTKEEKEYLTPIFEEVYQQAKEKYKNLNENIELFVIDKMHINAFAIGKKTIALTKGAIETFSADELRGVLAHEFGHIANGDTKALLLNVIGNGIFTLIIMFFKMILAILDFLTDLILLLAIMNFFIAIFRILLDILLRLFMLLGDIILSINSRQNEYLADKFAYDIGFGEYLINSLYILQKISLSADVKILDRLKASHPHLAYRIEKLEQMDEQENS